MSQTIIRTINKLTNNNTKWKEEKKKKINGYKYVSVTSKGFAYFAIDSFCV